MPSFSSRARIKRSMSERGQSLFLTEGKGIVSGGGMNAQWGWYCAPSAIHLRIVSFCSFVRERLESGGGIKSSGSLEKIFLHTKLSLGLPGTMACLWDFFLSA